MWSSYSIARFRGRMVNPVCSQTILCICFPFQLLHKMRRAWRQNKKVVTCRIMWPVSGPAFQVCTPISMGVHRPGARHSLSAHLRPRTRSSQLLAATITRHKLTCPVDMVLTTCNPWKDWGGRGSDVERGKCQEYEKGQIMYRYYKSSYSANRVIRENQLCQIYVVLRLHVWCQWRAKAACF